MLTFQLPLLFWVAILDLTWHRNYNLHFTDITSVIWRAITLDIVTFILIVIAIMIANIRSGCIGIYIFIHIRPWFAIAITIVSIRMRTRYIAVGHAVWYVYCHFNCYCGWCLLLYLIVYVIVCVIISLIMLVYVTCFWYCDCNRYCR